MTIDEAIKHAEEVAEKNERRAESVRNRPISSADFYHEEESCSKCADEHRQLAEWLKELKSLKEKADDIDEVGMANIKLALNDGAAKHIQKICNKSECGKCPYTLKKMSCIFSVCPMDWEVNDDEND